jgi:hypothetical protein
MHGTAGPIDFNVHQPNWKLASRLVRTFGGANDDGHEMCPAFAVRSCIEVSLHNNQ